jgi:hypothetical protein
MVLMSLVITTIEFVRNLTQDKMKDTWIVQCMIELNRTAADCGVYYRVLKDHEDDKK